MTSRAAKLPVTVVIPVLNEALNLPVCLSALGDTFREIVVVDSGSTDRTREIAEEAGAKVLTFHWDGGFPKKRNWTLRNHAFQTPWVLFLDADERVTAAFVEELSGVLERTGHNGFWISFTNWFMGRPLLHGDIFRKLALLRVGAGEYECFPENSWSSLDMEVHEHPVLTGTAGTVHARIEHHDVRSMDHYIKKHAEYATWEANRFCWLRSAGEAEWGRLTRRQQCKYRMLNKPGVGFFYFLVSYFIKLGFLDGLAGFRFAWLKGRYLDDIRVEIRRKHHGQ